MYCLPPTSVSTSPTSDSITINITEPTGSADIYQYSLTIQGGGINYGFSVQAVAPGGTVSRTINASMLGNNDSIIASTEYTIEISTTCVNNSTGWVGDSDTITTVVTTLAAPQPGCTDSGYVEYYTQGFIASVDDGSCQTVVVLGCTDDGNQGQGFWDDNGNGYSYANATQITTYPELEAVNYLSGANVDDGSCVQPTFGCTNSAATNYNSAATSDNGSCIILGCTDHGSIHSDGDGGFLVPTNYNPDATVEDTDNPCTYEGCTDTDADNYLGSHVTIHQPGSCHYLGCTDTDATNYSFQNAEACIDPTDITTCLDGSVNITTGATGGFSYLQGYAINDGSCNYAQCFDLVISTNTFVFPNGEWYSAVALRVFTNNTAYTNNVFNGSPTDFEVDVEIERDSGSGIVIYSETDITSSQNVISNSGNFNTPEHVVVNRYIGSSNEPAYGPSVINSTDYANELKVKFVVRSDDGVCVRTIEETFTAGCTDADASNTGQFDMTDMRKCTYV